LTSDAAIRAAAPRLRASAGALIERVRIAGHAVAAAIPTVAERARSWRARILFTRSARDAAVRALLGDAQGPAAAAIQRAALAGDTVASAVQAVAVSASRLRHDPIADVVDACVDGILAADARRVHRGEHVRARPGHVDRPAGVAAVERVARAVRVIAVRIEVRRDRRARGDARVAVVDIVELAAERHEHSWRRDRFVGDLRVLGHDDRRGQEDQRDVVLIADVVPIRVVVDDGLVADRALSGEGRGHREVVVLVIVVLHAVTRGDDDVRRDQRAGAEVARRCDRDGLRILEGFAPSDDRRRRSRARLLRRRTARDAEEREEESKRALHRTRPDGLERGRPINGGALIGDTFARMSDLSAKFEDAQKRVKQLSKTPSNDDLLQLYAFYKQATAGDVSGSRPGMLDLKGRAKYDAWAKTKGTSKDDAMTKYVALVDRLTAA
jgi:diazepam-binding inhibitor (GABA receptor modulator, acyl-CoA-binding protein)